jgi:polyisoprenoid-binding protein YceI
MQSNTISPVKRLILAGGTALVVAGSALGITAYSYLKPTDVASAPIESVFNGSMVSGDSVYTLDSSNTQATFTIDEVLRGEPKTVVGTTDQVAGQFTFDAANPSASQLGPITIDARTLATDDSSRNRALGNQILKTSQNEYITFTPTSLSGLPSTISAGQPFTFQATGDLTIAGTTQPATFDVTLTPADDGSLSGSATSTINYADWGVTIPSVPFVASVENTVVLGVTFSA